MSCKPTYKGVRYNSLEELYNLNSTNINNSQYKDLIKFLYDNGFIENIDVVIENIGGEGKYSPKTNSIIIDPIVANTYSPEEIIKVLSKEIVHAVTTYEIGKYFSVETGQRTETPLSSAMENLLLIFNTAKKTIPQGAIQMVREKIKTGKLTLEEKINYYPFIDIFEFVEMLFTEPKFREKMNTVKYLNTNKTILDKIFEVFKKLFGFLETDMVAFNALQASFKVMEDQKKSFKRNLEAEAMEILDSTIKPEQTSSVIQNVEELFESNPKLANKVYEALGFGKVKKEIKGINISTRSTERLGKRLTNPNWYAKDLMDVEAPYKANASKIKAPHLNADEALKYDMNLMYNLQVQKFRRNPELIDEINDAGGLEFIKNSSHIVGVKNSRWEGKGMESNFIKVLAKSYETVAKELNKFQESSTEVQNSEITPEQKRQAQQQYSQYLESLNKPNTNPILQGNQEEQVKKFTELQERLNNKEFLEGAKNAYESSKGLQEWGTQEQYNDYIARVSLGIIKNPSSGEYNYESKVRDIVYHGTNETFEEFLEDNLNYFGTKEIAKGYGKNLYSVVIEINKPYYEDGGNLSNQSYEDLYDKLDESGSDGFISNGKNLFVPKTKEQIHILGSKQDIEGFKNWVDNNQSNIQYQKQIDLQAEQDAVLEEFANSLSERFNISFDLISEEEAKSISPEYANEPAFFDPKTKKAYLVKGKANKTSAIHEIFTHPFLLQIEKTNSTLYKNLLKEAKNNKSVVDYVDNLYGTNQNNDHEYIARAIDLAVQGELNQQKDKTLLERIQDFFNQLSNYLKRLFNIPEVFSSAISPNITLQQLAQFAMYGKGKMNLNPAQENVEYSLKATDVIVKNLDRVKQWEKNKSVSEDVLWSKIQGLGVPKEQLELIKNSEGNTVEEKLLDFVNQYSFTIEINTAIKEDKSRSSSYIDDFTLNGDVYSTQEVGDADFGGFDLPTKNGEVISEEEYKEAKNEYFKLNQIKTSYYSNLTVPGGTNYTENEISTPLIKPSIKGHAEFSTDNGIGWFRSDDRAKPVENSKEKALQRAIENDDFLPFDEDYLSTETTDTKTRRILEIQSDWGQNQRKSSEPDINVKYDIQQIINDLQKSGDLKIDCN